MIKKILTVGIVTFFILNSVAFAVVGGMNFTDQSKFVDWNSAAIEHLQEEGIIKGYSDGEFKPNNNVTRAEMAVMMDRMYDKLVGKMDKITTSYDGLNNGLENVKFPIVVYERPGLLYNSEKGKEELKKLEEKLISPLTDYYNEEEVKLVAITITIPTDIGVPYGVDTVSVPGVGSGSFIFGKRELDYDFWKPECMGPCEFSELFKKKYPQIIN